MRRWSRLVVASAAILLGALLVAALSSLTLDLGSKIGKELRGYGANVILAPRDSALAVGSGGLDFGEVAAERYLAEVDLVALEDPAVAADIVGYAPYLYGVVDINGQQAILAGTRLDRVLAVNPWWNVAGSWVTRDDRTGTMVGSNVADQLGLEPGDVLVVQHRGHRRELTVRGVVDTGAAEDSQVFVDLPVAQELLDRPGAVALVQVSAETARQAVGDTAAALERALPGARARVIGQIAEAEASVFQKIQLLMALVAALVLVAASLSVAGTMTTAVLERTREIGLLKALGAGDARIAGLFLAETAVIGLTGSIVGYVLGVVVAQIVARGVFDSALALHWLSLPATVGVAVMVALLGSIVPVRRALAIDPAVTLRGE